MTDPQALREALDRVMAQEGTWTDGTRLYEAITLIENAERVWWCDYPELNDENCTVRHRPDDTVQPRKHTGCGWIRLLREEK